MLYKICTCVNLWNMRYVDCMITLNDDLLLYDDLSCIGQILLQHGNFDHVP